MFSALADRYGDLPHKLNLFVAFAPAVYIRDDADEWLKNLAEHLDPEAVGALHALGIYELFGDGWDKIRDPFCMLFTSFCDEHGIIKVVDGPNVDPKAAAFANARPHSSIAVKAAMHYAELFSAGVF